MKLIRLTTEDETANFKNTFNDDIIIEPFSSIALLNLTTQIETSQIVIDAQNNEIVFQIAGVSRSIILNHGTYDKTNIDDLFTDFTNKLNLSLTYRQSELAKQFQVSTSQNKFVVQLKTGLVAKAVRDLTAGPTNKLIGSRFVNQVFSGGANPEPIYIQRNGGTDTTNDSFVFIKSPITKGCGSSRARIYSTPAGASGGYIIGLLSDPVDVNTTVIDPTKIVFGVRFIDMTQPYKIIKNGVQSVSTVSPIASSTTGGASNDTITLNVFGGKIYADVVNTQPAAVPPATVGARANGLNIDSIDYNQQSNLYPVLIMVSSQTTIEHFSVSTDPFYNTANNIDTVPEDIDYGLGAIPAFVPNAEYNTVLTFNDVDLAKTLGFLQARIPAFTNPNNEFIKTVKGSAEYKASQPLVFRDVADTYLVEMMNLNIDSYDSIRTQHMNLLSVIPQFDAVRERLVYSAIYPVFLSLNNPYRINLREIRARILKEDLTEISTTGYSQITILIDN
jgi:hypothetical protein